MCTSVGKAPPVLVSFDPAFVLKGKEKQLDDVIMAVTQ